MLIISHGQWRWISRQSVVYTAACLGVCTQLIVTVPVSAAGLHAKERLPSRQSWGKARMGVTAVVLQRCAVTVTAAAESRAGQPVEVRCTENTEYGLSVTAASGPEVTIRPGGQQTVAANTTLPGGAGTSHYMVEQQDSQTADQTAVPSGPAILSIDF